MDEIINFMSDVVHHTELSSILTEHFSDHSELNYVLNAIEVLEYLPTNIVNVAIVDLLSTLLNHVLEEDV